MLILEFRECFYLFARTGQISTLDELTVIMRSLGLSPTIQELTSYLKKKNGKMSFADFLDVMHQHTKVENLPDEVIAAFKAADTMNRGALSAKQLRHLLQNWGEGLSVREVLFFLFLFFYLKLSTKIYIFFFNCLINRNYFSYFLIFVCLKIPILTQKTKCLTFFPIQHFV